jgi:hypothetical protein
MRAQGSSSPTISQNVRRLEEREVLAKLVPAGFEPF